MLSAPARQLRAIVRVPSTRSLVSSVLLSRTAADWQAEPMSKLKEECQKRGLSINGNKKNLVNRLVKAEQTRDLGSLSSGSPSPSAAAPVAPKPPTPTPPTPPPLVQQLMTRPTSTSAVVHAAATPRDKFTPRSHQLAIELPEEVEEEEPGPAIPSLPDNFTSSSENSASPHQTPTTARSEPKVLTVASASTHLDGGPTHTMFESTDAHAEELSSASQWQEVSSLPEAATAAAGVLDSIKDAIGWEKVFGKTPSAKEVQARAKEGANAAVAELTAGLSSVQQYVGIPQVEQGGYAKDEGMRDMHSEEKLGIWVLLGIVTGGWILGGVLAPAKAGGSHDDHH